MIVGLVAAIRPVSFDMSKPLTVDVTCGSLNLTARAKRNRCGYNLSRVAHVVYRKIRENYYSSKLHHWELENRKYMNRNMSHCSLHTAMIHAQSACNNSTSRRITAPHQNLL